MSIIFVLLSLSTWSEHAENQPWPQQLDGKSQELWLAGRPLLQHVAHTFGLQEIAVDCETDFVRKDLDRLVSHCPSKRSTIKIEKESLSTCHVSWNRRKIRNLCICKLVWVQPIYTDKNPRLDQNSKDIETERRAIPSPGLCCTTLLCNRLLSSRFMLSFLPAWFTRSNAPDGSATLRGTLPLGAWSIWSHNDDFHFEKTFGCIAKAAKAAKAGPVSKLEPRCYARPTPLSQIQSLMYIYILYIYYIYII